MKRTMDVGKTYANYDGTPVLLPSETGAFVPVTIGRVLGNIVGGMRPKDGIEVLAISEFGGRIVRAMKDGTQLELDEGDCGFVREAIRQDIMRARIAERKGEIAGSSALMLAPLVEATRTDTPEEGATDGSSESE